MTIGTSEDYPALDIREKLVHIDQMLADIERTYIDRDRKRQEISLAPWQVIFAGATAASALFGAGAAVGAIFVKVFHL